MITRRMRRRRQALSAYVHGELEIYQQLKERQSPEPETLPDADAAVSVTSSATPTEGVCVNKVKVLFLCTGNAARSQMAEALLRELAGDRFDAHSAGLHPAGIDERALIVMRERGIDIGGQRAKHLSEFLGKVHFGFLITLCDRAEHECPTAFPGVSTRLKWTFEDPAAAEGSGKERLEKFREVRDQIEARIAAWLADQEAHRITTRS